MSDIDRPDRPPRVRETSAAGLFYPADPGSLRAMIARFLRDANRSGPIPRGLICPHAGYPYSGPVAASGYALLEPVRHRIQRVLLLGPSHRVPFHGLAISRADAFATPLGTIPVDPAAMEILRSLPQIQILDEAHRQEHSLEVQLPMLQMSLGEFSLVPIVIGRARAEEVADVLGALWNPESLLVVSSDLSHYHDGRTAHLLDRETARLIEGRQWQRLDGERACGYGGIRGLLKYAEDHNLQVKTVDLRNSGDTQGGKDRVVGYGCFAVT